MGIIAFLELNVTVK